MTDNDQLTPPLELVEQWSPSIAIDRKVVKNWQVLATHAAQWGYKQRGAVNEAELQKARDEELEACCEWASQFNYDDYRYQDELRALRRPKPKSQAEEALKALDDAMIGGHIITTSTAAPTIRAALERLRKLEGNQ